MYVYIPCLFRRIYSNVTPIAGAALCNMASTWKYCKASFLLSVPKVHAYQDVTHVICSTFSDNINYEYELRGNLTQYMYEL